MSESATIILGDEYDDSLRNALREVLLNKGAAILAGDWSLGGSQELETIRVPLNGQELIVESETFIGLNIRGPKASVEAVARDVVKRGQICGETGTNLFFRERRFDYAVEYSRRSTCCFWKGCMDQVINGIEAQKQEDQSILSKPVSGPDGQDYPHARPRWCNTPPPQSLTITTGKDFNQVSLRDTHQISGKRWIHNVSESISLFVANSQQKIKTSIKLLAAKGDMLIQAQSNDVEITADRK